MRAIVRSGICGFTTHIETLSDDSQHVCFRVESDCQNIKTLAGLLGEIDAYSELAMKSDGDIHSASRAAKLCSAGCPVPGALHKAAQVAAGLALPRNASIEFEE